MPYLFILQIFVIAIAFCLKVGAVYFLLKLFKSSARFLKLFNFVLFYELGSVVFYILVSNLFSGQKLIIIFVAPVILGVLFVSLIKRFSVLRLKRAIAIFVLFFVLVTPIIGMITQFIGSSIIDIPSIEKRIPDNLHSRSLQSQLPLPIKVNTYIENSIFGQYYLTSIREYLLSF